MIPYRERLRQLKNVSASPSAEATADTAAIFDALCRLIADVLQLPDGNFDPKRSFKDLGLSSLLAVRLLDRINRRFNLRLGVEALFNYGDTLRLAAHIASLSPSAAATPTSAAQKPDPDKTTDKPTVAIIGYAGKFASAANPDELWQALSENRQLISRMPDYRRQNRSATAPLAGFLTDAERFDAAFFGISPREAAAMDPIQRHFLEQAWCALEHAGLTGRQLAGEKIGVYVGASGSGYEHSVPISGKAVDAYVMTGNLASMTAARVAYFLDLDGPAVTVDTACSSSLTAVHLACQALLSGEIDIALAGGASLFIDERAFEAMARAGMTSASHACRAFDDRADGIVVAEGAGCVILKTLMQAQADGDRIEACICASGVNQDGRSNGITAPNALAQAKLLRQVLAKAQIAADSIDLIETHGTGTRLGDPIEAAALREVYANRPSAKALRIAALKSCLGHGSEAAGIAGLISTLTAMRYGIFPPIVGFQYLNTHISLPETGNDVLAFSGQAAVWPQSDQHPRRAAVSSFGLSGTNVHLIVEQVPTPIVSPPAPSGPFLFVLSAASSPDLERRRKDLALWLSEQSDTVLPALAHTLLWHREAMTSRWGAYAHSVAELREKLVNADNDPNDPVLGLWLAGQTPQADWLALPAYPPLALPTYPFYGPRLWGGAVLPETDHLTQQDPLLGRLQADGSFLREFHATDPLVADHQVGGQTILHAGVLLEVCQAAIDRHGPGCSALSEFTWLKPLAVSGTAQVGIRINDGVLSIVCQDTIYATAQVSAITQTDLPETLNDPAALLASLPTTEIAAGQASDAIFLGPSFPGPDQIRADGCQAVAFLEHASRLPTVLDTAIRAAAAASGSAETGGFRLRFPTRLAQLRHFAPLPKQGFYFHACRRNRGLPRFIETVDVTVYDRDGTPLLYLDGLALAAALEPASDITAQTSPPQSPSSWRITWRETPAPSHCYRQQSVDLLIADAEDGLAKQLADVVPVVRRLPFADVALAPEGLPRRANIWFFDDGAASRVMDLFRLVQALSKAGLGNAELSLRIIGNNAVAVGDESVINANGAAVFGLAKAAGREFPTWRVKLVDYDSETANYPDIIDRLLSEPGDPLGEPVALRTNNRRFLQRLAALDEHGAAATVRLSRDDHIIILGGMGRLGRACARHFAGRYQARLSLIGRSPETDIQLEFLEELRTLGSNARYFIADIGDATQLEKALDSALAIHGPAALLIQATVDPAFARLERALPEEFEAALTPKTVGLRNIGLALATRPIAALAVFSSIGAFTGFPANDGQASYSAGCNFEAGHALQLMRTLSKPVRIIHWGLWDSGDYGEDALARLQAGGLEPMALEQLGDTLEALLHTPYPQLVHAQLAGQTWLDLGAPPTQAVAAVFAEAARQALASPSPIKDRPDNLAAAKALLTQKISDGLVAVFTARGFTAGLSLSLDEAEAKLAVLSNHRQIARALLNMAVRQGLGAWDAHQPRFTFFGPVAAAAVTQQFDAMPGLEASLRLLDRCLDALPQLLAGECSGTDILFPAGSMDWVEPIYRDQPVLADCSRRLAAVVATVAKGGRRILEIGAGTGSTAGPVLDALDAAGLAADSHYVYTDISRAFVNHGQSRFARRLAEAKVLDISRPPENQGFELAAWDIIIASNVLHATADISQTLAHVTALSAPGGIVLINEMVEPDDFATLTFGLLDGWWESQDLECRLADGPILGIAGWQERLRSVGLQGRWAYDRYGDANGSDGGQSILLAFKPSGMAVTPRPATISDTAAKPATAQPLPAAASANVQSQCEMALRNILAQILGMAAERIERERPFMEMGVDSLIAPQIAEEAQSQLACPLRVTDIYKYGNLAALANHLGSSYGERFLASMPEEAAPAPQAVTSPVLASQNGIAIIGLSARFAGAPDIDALWKLLDQGRHAISEVDRFDINPWFDEKGGADKTYARWGGFLDDYDRFDPYFFNITPAEAEVMDPQQRVLMEETWKALENAGLDPNSLAAKHCGLFVGASANNYQTEGASGLRTLGSSMAILSARMAYVLNLHGPNFPIDTGCSSSLAAVHQACQSLRSGECDLALAGGVSVNLISPDIYLYLSDAGMISRQGVGRTFDDAADGFVPGEGAGMVVLKRLADALADGDRIDAVIIGSGINQDGRTAGLTAPSSEAQAALTLSIYQRYGLNPADFGMIEAHGTGTPLGDPIEVQALTDTFRRYTERNGGCAIGSIKTNIGHTMAAAGMAGIAKAVLALRHRRIPASLNFKLANRHIDFANTPFFVPTESVPWPEGRAAQAAVSSFGFSGTNAHVVLQAGIMATSQASAGSGPWLFALSARDANALKRRLLDLADWLREQSDVVDLARVADTLARGRAHWRYRCAIIAGDRLTLASALEQAAGLQPIAVPNDHIPQSIAATARPDDLPVLAARYQQGDMPDWQALFGSKKPPLALPGYPFARERFWAMAAPSDGQTDVYRVDSDHPLLNAHYVGGTAILPGTLSLELMRGDAPAIENVAWLRPLSLADTPARMRLVGTEMRGLMTDDNSRLAEGRLGSSTSLASPPPDFAPNIRLDGEELYRRLAAGGFDYGKPLRVISFVEIGSGIAKARLLPPAELQDDPLLLGAALLDGALQTAAAIGYSRHGDVKESDEGQWVPYRLGALRVRHRLSGPCTATAWLEDSSDKDRLIFNVIVHDDAGVVLAGFESMTAHRLALPDSRPQIYRPIWRPDSAATSLVAPASIVFYDTSERLLGIVRKAFPGAEYRIITDDSITPETLQTLSALPTPLLVIQALPEQTTQTEPSATVANALAAADPLPIVRTAFELMRTLLSAGQQDDVRLLTVGAAAVNTPVWNAAASIAGLYRTLKLEAPGVDARVLLSASTDVLEAVLVREITIPAGQDPLLYYDAALVRQVRAWQALPVTDATAPLPKGQGTVLISGGLGGLGLALAERLAEEGAVQIALLSRSAVNPTHRERIAAIEKSGATVMTLAVDVGNPRALSNALNTVRDTLGPITAVYHLAGVLHDGFLLNKDKQALADVFHAKVRGAILLDELTRNDNLDNFVLFGSTAAVFGSVGQADYGAANAFLAAFADTRRARGNKTLCVHWPLWADGGMQPSAETCAFLAGLGMKALPSALGLEQLAQLAASAETGSALLLYGDSGLFGRLHGGTASRKTANSSGQALAANAGLSYVCELLASIVKLPPERVEADLAFEELGIDSIAIMKLNRQMENDLGPVAKTLFFEYRTPGALAAHLQDRKAQELAAYFQAKTPAMAPEQPLAIASPRFAPAATTVPVTQEAIAIVGVAGLYPMAANLDEFWNNLLSARDCIDEIPSERWPLEGFYDPDPNKAATSHCKWGGFIADADCFDTRFFGISPLEAETIDPQARKFLETTWNALEDAGLDPERMFDSWGNKEVLQRRCGVFVGVMYGDYQLFGPEEAQKGNLIGPNADYWNIANRVSAFLDLHGPSMAVDTACSSSLSAIHLACQSIRSGDCVMAVAGGVNLCLHPRRHWILSKAGMAASDGRCHSFGAGGDGYVPGEGIGAVILKPLSRAKADGDRIQGVILGSALNHGGRTSGYTVPNPVAQGDAVAAALDRAGIDPRSISYLEAHGTGTPLGDPIEIRGLARAFSEAMPENCAIGSVKGNIGHLESAAGIAGLTKVLLQMRKRTLAPTLYADPPNPDLDLSGTGFRLATRQEVWQGSPLRAGISSFGAGGANAHLIIEAGEQRATASANTDTSPQLLLLSARDEDALRQRAGQLAAHLLGETGQLQSLADIAHTLSNGRKAFGERLAVIGADKNDLAGLLHRFAQGDTELANLWRGRAGKNIPAATGNDPATLAAAWVAGSPPPPLAGHRIELPAYPFAKRRLWVKISTAQAVQVPLVDTARQFFAGQPPLSDHLIAGRSLLPGAFSLLAALETAPEPSLRDVSWPMPGIAASGQALTIHCEYKDGQVTVLSDKQEQLLKATTATIPTAPDIADISSIIAICPRRIDAAAIYAALASAGAEYGPSLQALNTVYCGDGIAVARLRDGCSAPAVLDAAFQLCFALIPEQLSGQALLPAKLAQISVIADLTAAKSLVAMRRETNSRGITADFFLLDDSGNTLAWLDGFQALSATVERPGDLVSSLAEANLKWPLRLLRPEWTAIAMPSAMWTPKNSWIITESANDALGSALSQHWNASLGNIGQAPSGLPDAVVIILGSATPELADNATRTGKLLESLRQYLRDWSGVPRPYKCRFFHPP